jgi:hypothetical protein
MSIPFEETFGRNVRRGLRQGDALKDSRRPLAQVTCENARMFNVSELRDIGTEEPLESTPVLNAGFGCKQESPRDHDPGEPFGHGCCA